MLGAIEGAVVKWDLGYSSCRTLLPEAAQSLIREKVAAGLRRRQEQKPFRMGDSLVLDLVYRKAQAAELVAYLPNVERIESHAVRFVGDIIEISMFIEVACSCPASSA